MPMPKHARRLLALTLAVLAVAAPPPPARGQQTSTTPRPQTRPPAGAQTPPRKADEQDEVIRIDTELVQAAVTVLDGKGQFVDGLRPEQFELRVDGRATPVSFFERVSAGTAKELGLLAAAASRSPQGPAAAAEDTNASVAGRTVYFFLDDMHLSAASVGRARRMVLNYVNGLMGEGDWAAVASTSGQIGFLQQLTDDKAVLRKAVGRVGYAQPIVTDSERPKIRVEEAFAVLEREDQNVLEHLVNETLRNGPPGMTRAIAEALVRSRVRDIMRAAAELNRNTLKTLHSLLRTSAARPGRKVVFFVSDGFMLQTQNADDRELLQRVTDAAARADAVVFSVDAKGLATDPDYQAARDGAFDSHGLLAAASPGALGLFLSPEPLRQLAAETGGRAVLNTNAPDAGIARALEETSRYYLLAWRPEGDGQRGGRFRRLEVRVVGRPDLSVRVHRGFLAPQAPPPTPAANRTATASDPSAAGGASPARAPQEELRAAVGAAYPPTRLPTTLAAVHTDAPGGGGATLAVSVGVGSESLTFKAVEGGRAAAAVDFACVVLNDEGKPTETFYKRLEAATRAAVTDGGVPSRAVVQDFQFTLRPGLYQVRAAARDVVSGRTGGAVQWIEIPDLSKGGLALSGLALGEVTVAPQGDGAAGVLAAQAAARPTAGRPLARGSRLHFSAFVHNAARGANGALPPAVSVRAEVLAGGRVVADTGERDLSTDGLEDFARLPYAAEVGLEGLPAGRYLLRVTAVDRAASASVARQVKFEIR